MRPVLYAKLNKMGFRPYALPDTQGLKGRNHVWTTHWARDRHIRTGAHKEVGCASCFRNRNKQKVAQDTCPMMLLGVRQISSLETVG